MMSIIENKILLIDIKLSTKYISSYKRPNKYNNNCRIRDTEMEVCSIIQAP